MGKAGFPWNVVHNGVDLERYTPNGSNNLPNDRVRLLLVEGTIGSGYEMGLEIAIHTAERLANSYNHIVEVMVVGRVNQGLQREWKSKTRIDVIFTEEVPADKDP